jgi:hypothetical protein
MNFLQFLALKIRSWVERMRAWDEKSQRRLDDSIARSETQRKFFEIFHQYPAKNGASKKEKYIHYALTKILWTNKNDGQQEKMSQVVAAFESDFTAAEAWLCKQGHDLLESGVEQMFKDMGFPPNPQE